MKILKSFSTIFNWKTVVILVISVAASIFCREYQFTASFPMTLVGIAVVFPLVFSINSAYKRRETALIHYGTLKGNARAIFFASRDWIDNPAQEKVEEMKNALERLFSDINIYLHTSNEAHDNAEKEILKEFRLMSLCIKGFRAQGMSGSEVSRTNQYLSKMMVAFEQLKHIYQYRTPLTLRAYSKVFIYVIPIVYGPYFADITMEKPFVMSFILPSLFSVLLVSLDNIQEHLENPFDRQGEDDVYFNAEKFINGLDC